MPYFLAQEKATRQYDAAFHLLKVTFPMVQDPKMLPGIVHNLHFSMVSAMESILAYEKKLNLIPAYGDSFRSKLSLFQVRSARRYSIPQHILSSLEELHEIVEMHKTTPMNFKRGNSYVLASKEYQMKVLSIRDLEVYLEHAKEFVKFVDVIINRKE